MEQNIKQIKDSEKQEELEKEVIDVQTGRLEVEIKPAEVVEEIVEAPKKTFAKRKFERNKRGRREEGPADDFEQKIIDLARVTRVTKGGKRLRFRACVAIGDRNGQVGLGLAKGQDVTMAISKAVVQAKKSLVTIPIVNGTIPHEITEKFKAAKILLKPAKVGKGVIAGGSVRIILQLGGVSNIVAKILGNNNKLTNALVTISALKKFKKVVASTKKSVDHKPKAEKSE
ncbi:MAG: 30S ribosomal protein S5 [Patescibacteria group bacterium]